MIFPLDCFLIMNRRILDDGFNHVLTIYEDKSTRGIRLSATVREGVLKRTPVWTAFGEYLILYSWLCLSSSHDLY
jgi:hypothetical protein